jgi:4-hydroxy-tetrahydrodipicolinate reductase
MSERPVRLAIVGMGKMGRAIDQLAPERGFTVVARIDPESDGAESITRESLGRAEVAVEFTVPEAAAGNVLALIDCGCPAVVGTTGWYERLPEVTDHARAAGGGFLHAPNFSIGVNIFSELVAAAGRLLGPVAMFDAHMVETHHSAKKDAPSGTAAMLEEVAKGALGRSVPITSVRTGSVPGTHELVFDAPFETIRIEHVARDRRVFAEGALVAARWLVGRSGVFTMKDVLAPQGSE